MSRPTVASLSAVIERQQIVLEQYEEYIKALTIRTRHLARRLDTLEQEHSLRMDKIWNSTQNANNLAKRLAAKAH